MGIPVSAAQTPPAGDLANAYVGGRFTGTGQSPTFSAYGSFNVVLWGNSGPMGPWNGTVRLEKTFDGGTTWVVQSIDQAAGSQASWTSAGTPGFPGLDVATTFREVELGVGYRLNCIVFSNGPINYRMSTTSPAPSAWGIFP